jgi:aarF domain-containing kinase
LIDHGLYVSESDEFRHQYCLFWKSLFLLDLPQMERICHDWGIQDMSIFASATLQRPFNPRKAIHITSAQRVSMEDLYHLQVHNKERIKKFLSDTEKIPLELIFVGRTLNLVRSNNKYFGSPVNRINLMAEWAVQGLGSDWSYWARNSDGQQRAELQRGSLLQMLRDSIYPRMNYWWFRMNLMWISVGFHLNRTVQWVGEWLTGKRMKGFEDRMDSQMIQAMRNMGIVVNSDSFEA